MFVSGRAKFLRLAVVGFLIVLVGRLSWVQVVMSEEIIHRVEEMRLPRQELTPIRGSMLDRNGKTVAVSIPASTVVANTMQMKDPAGAAARLAPVLNMGADAIRTVLQANPNSGWVPLKRRVPHSEAEAVKALRVEGISLVPDSIREYPQGATANQIIGYVDPTGTTGEYGLEAHYEKELRGTPGYIRAEFTAANVAFEETIKEFVPSRPGFDLVLTVDIGLQKMVEARLDQVVKEKKANRALVIAMDAHTGEILVMAMRPGAHPGDRKTWLDKDGNVDFTRLNNWAVTPMPPGSIFKTITTAIALEERTITLEKTFTDEGIIRIDGWPLRNWDQFIPPKPVPMTIAELMQTSSNVGLIKVGQTIPNDAWIRYMKGFGFMDRTGLDASTEFDSRGLEGFEAKYKVDWANMYIGQHLEVTPIQMVTAFAAIANGGYLIKPHLVREVRHPDGRVVSATPASERRQVISAATAREVQAVLQSVVEKGTARAARVEGYTAGGKTGTAQKFENGKIKDYYLADFIGFAPADNPQIVMLVMVDEPKEGQGFGGLVAAPEFANLMPHVLRSVGIMPAAAAEQKAPQKPAASMVPNVQWLPVAWANERLFRAGLVPKLKGTGPVVTGQSEKPEAAVKPGTVVELNLSEPDPKLAEKVYVPDFTGLSITEADQLAREIGLTLKPTGAGFVSEQEHKPGTLVAARSALWLRLAPPRTQVPAGQPKTSKP